jgi:hypothetical protein
VSSGSGSWPGSAIDHATSYTVYQSTASQSGPYSIAEAEITTTSWLSPPLAAHTYWYEIRAVVGTNWSSVNSAATDTLDCP